MKRFSLLTALLAVPLLFTACFDQKDFDFDKFDTAGIKPTFYLPLLTDEMSIRDAGLDGLLFDATGQAYFEYGIESIDMPAITDMLSISAQDAVTVNQPLPSQIGDIPPGMGSADYPLDGSMEEVTADLDINSESSGMRPDKVVFSKLTLSFQNITTFSSGTLHISIPALTKDNVPFTWDIPVTNTAPQAKQANGYTLEIDHGGTKPNEFKLEYRLEHISTDDVPMTQVGFTLGIDDVEIGEVHGNFGQYTKDVVNEPIEIGDFDALDGTWDLKEAFIILEVQNPLVLPVGIKIDQITTYDRNDVSDVHTAGLGEGVIEAAAVLGTPASSTVTLGGTGLGEVVSTLPKRMDVKLSVTTNPAGGDAMNAIGSGALTAAAKVRVPLQIRNTEITLTDTLDFSVGDVSLGELGINLHVENEFPVALELSAELWKKDTKDTSLGWLIGSSATEGETIAADGITDKMIAIKEDMAQKMKQSDRVKIYFTARVPGNEYQTIRETDRVRFRIGLKAAIDFDSLDI